MHHLLLGIDPVELGGAPFALATDHSLTLRGERHRLQIASQRTSLRAALHRRSRRRGCRGHGARRAPGPRRRDDAAGGRRHERRNRAGQQPASASPAPARPVPRSRARRSAAVSARRPERSNACASIAKTLEPRFKVIGSDLWSDDAGFDQATAATGITGVCGSGIIEVIAEMYLAGIINQDGVLDGRLAARSPRIVANGRTFAYLLHRGRASR